MRWLITLSLLAGACGSRPPVPAPPAPARVEATPTTPAPTDRGVGATCAADADCQAPLRCVFSGTGVKGCLEPDVDRPTTKSQASAPPSPTARTGVAGAYCRTDADCDAPLRCYAGGAGSKSCRTDVDLSP